MAPVYNAFAGRSRTCSPIGNWKVLRHTGRIVNYDQRPTGGGLAISSNAPNEGLARYGWESSFPEFSDAEPRVVRISLEEFLKGAGELQVVAWDESIPQLQREVGEVVDLDDLADTYTAILEYELPMESRRPDVILLVNGAVVVLELKGKSEPTQADLDPSGCVCTRPPVLPQALRRARSARGPRPH